MENYYSVENNTKKIMKIYFKNFKTPQFLIHIIPTAVLLTVFILQNFLLNFEGLINSTVTRKSHNFCRRKDFTKQMICRISRAFDSQIQTLTSKVSFPEHMEEEQLKIWDQQLCCNDALLKDEEENPPRTQRITATLYTSLHKYGFKWPFAKLQPAGEWLEKPLSSGSVLRATEKFLTIPRHRHSQGWVICWRCGGLSTAHHNEIATLHCLWSHTRQNTIIFTITWQENDHTLCFLPVSHLT